MWPDKISSQEWVLTLERMDFIIEHDGPEDMLMCRDNIGTPDFISIQKGWDIPRSDVDDALAQHGIDLTDFWDHYESLFHA